MSPDAHSPAARLRARDAGARALRSLEFAWRAAPWSLTAYAILTVASGLLPAGVALVTKWLLDTLQEGGAAAGVPGPLANRPLLLVMFLGLFTLLTAMSVYLTTYLESRIRRGVALLVQQRLYGAVNGIAGLRRFEEPAFLDRLRLAQASASTAPEEIIGSLFGTARGVLAITSLLGILLAISPVIAVITIAAALPMLFVRLLLDRQRAGMMWRMSPRMRRQMFYQELMLTPAANKEVRLFGTGAFLLDRMRGEIRRTNREEEVVDRRVVLTHAPLALLGALVSAGGLVWMVASALRGEFTIGDVSAFIAAVAGVQGALVEIVMGLTLAHQSLLLMGHYDDVIGTPSDLPVPADPRPVGHLREGIRLEDVWFRYTDDGPWVLRGVSLTVPARGSLAVVGLNGAGKSTLVKLLSRMYDPTRGRVLWDGVDIREMDVADLRARMSAVFQDYMSYDLPVRENIALGSLEHIDDTGRIRDAAREAGADRFVSELPHGYATMLSRVFYQVDDDFEAGDDTSVSGTTLSGGQWQRLAFARSLIRRDRDLLILDEPASGLDPEAEREVREKVRAMRDGTATLLVSHRLGSVRDADLIVVLEEGEITERGGHEELMALGGEYARLFTMQAEGYADGGPGTPGAWTGHRTEAAL
ncbi:ATP-binding cassette subfamily B protein [Nocardiopsis sp. Huas11]|uniref:ABC transporter ATP-binding protein n=1 Tax=Nocardiopsis sp. Huas11 TaxID=2183912 RepID=UPI000EB4DFCE|nr:ABC transporter ATP-binding protein [Nocardiopsis sp. Huas11]RKS09257.1 ATP-binding cassette subfamily B protein [Nocardiopsis sp. Huas11]